MSLAVVDAPSRLEEAPDAGAVSAPEGFTCPRCDRPFKNRAGLRGHEMFCRGPGTHRGKKTGGQRRAAAKAPSAPAPSRAREAKPRANSLRSSGSRKSAAGVLGLVWQGAARAFPSPAGARAMLWQTPAAGRILDTALAGSVVDRKVLQRVSGESERWKAASGLVSLPIMCAMVEANPKMYGPLYPFMRAAVAEGLEAALDAAIEAKARAARIKEKADKADLDLEHDEQGNRVEDPIDHALKQMLGVPSTEPEEAA